MAASIGVDAYAERLVMLHTNDTHSQIDPLDNGKGGVFRRKVLIDSVKAVEPNVMLIDAGDAEQGTLFFTLYGGEVEHRMMNFLGYDLAIVGNHSFDNGSEALAKNLEGDSAVWITTNYDLRGGVLDRFFRPYYIKQVGDKRVGFIGLNIDPVGLVSDGNYDGVKYIDAIKAGNATAWHLKHNERVDYVVAVTHLGYNEMPGPSDVDLAKRSEDIDVIIGGHSHTLINPADVSSKTPSRLVNAVGDTVVVAQLNRSGQYLGEIVIDFDADKISNRIISVDSRLDSCVDPAWNEPLKPYRHGVDSLLNQRVGSIPVSLEKDSEALLNLVGDFVKSRGDALSDCQVDLAIINKGGIRCGLPKGSVTQGRLMMMMPFENSVLVMDIKGSDLLEALDVMCSRRGDGVSREVNATMNPDGHCSAVSIGGKALNPDKIYRIATIDYLANGGDYMTPLTRGTVVSRSSNLLYDDMIEWFRSGKARKIKIDNTRRMHY